jgi:pyruvate kinase
MLDTKGPEIRTGKLDPSLGGKLVLTKGDTIEVGTDYARLGTKEYLPCSYKSLPTSVKPGGRVLVADGSLLLEVVECREESIVARILNNATIGERKNMNLPGAYVDLPTLADQDVIDLRDFGVAHGVDFIAASFVRKAEDIRNIRAVLGEDGKDIKIIAKIENIEGLENFDDILKEVRMRSELSNVDSIFNLMACLQTDGIMVARGDLGMEIPLEKVFLAQKFMINKVNIISTTSGLTTIRDGCAVKCSAMLWANPSSPRRRCLSR